MLGIELIAAYPVGFPEIEMDEFLIGQRSLIPLARQASAVGADRPRAGFRHGEDDLTPAAVDDLGASIHQGFVAGVDVRVIVVRPVAVFVARPGVAENDGRCKGKALHVAGVRDAVAVGAHDADHVGAMTGVPGICVARVVFTGQRKRLARGEWVCGPRIPIPETGSAIDALLYDGDKATAGELHVFGLDARIHDADRDALSVIPQGIRGRRSLRGEPPAAQVFRRFPTRLRR